MSWLDALAEHTATLHPDLTYRPDAPYTDLEVGVVVGPIPSHPPRVVAVATYGGAESDSKLRWDEPNVQWRVRGTADERVSRGIAQAIYDRMHGAGPFALPDGTRLQLAVGQQSGPISLGFDDQGRQEHTVNARIEIERVTEHRP